MITPHNVEFEEEELNALIDRIEKHKLREADYPLITDLIRSMSWLSQQLEEKSITIHRLRKIFGFKTERTSNINNLNSNDQNMPAGENDIVNPVSESSSTDPRHQEEKNPETPNPKTEKSADEPTQENGKPENDNPVENPKKERKGKRYAATDYKSAIIIKIPHPTLCPGYRCPICKRGNLRFDKPGIYIRLIGQPWLQAFIYESERLRCNTCGKTFTAPVPLDVATAPKYDDAAKAIVCLLKYRGGFPFYRQESLQTMLETPISDSELWKMTRDVAVCLESIYQMLIQDASKGQCIHNDDTKARILDLIIENKSKDKKKDRVGIHTSAILSKLENREIALFFTGRQHAGENLNDVLNNRPDEMPTPTQMCDASNNNRCKDHDTDEANCLAHLRRKFYEIVEIWPKYVLPMIFMLNTIFENQREAKKLNLNKEDSLKLHQEKSEPVMNQLEKYGKALIAEKKTEPNSNLGKAINYMFNHWNGFTLFLKKEEVPLDNNDDERLMKRAVLNRKNGLFFKTQYGAYCGDVLLSVIETCQLNKINPYHYLLAVQKYEDYILKDPNLWLPWNYQLTIADLGLIPISQQPSE